jgi:hypothetical protein
VNSRFMSRRNLRSVAALLALALGGLTPTVGHAYTAAGDRNFSANIVLPQVAPADAFYGTTGTQPFDAGATGEATRQTNIAGSYSKTITERVGIQIEGVFSRLDRLHAPGTSGFQNLDVLLQYEPIVDQQHELVLTLGVDREFPGTGDQGVGASRRGATRPAVFFAKGLGDLDIGYWRPLAVTGLAAYQIGDRSPRPDMYNAGFSVQYSIPYLESKVAAVDLPDIVRGLTPMTEVLFTGPAGRSYGQRVTALVAPGVSYSNGGGWEFGIEALIPATKATGSGVGIAAQLLLQLDYLLPGSILGRPLFRPR